MKTPLLAAFLALAATAMAQEGGAVAQMADGSSIPLTSWTLSYEYVAWKPGTPQYQAPPQRRDGNELLLAKRSYPVTGHALAVVYSALPRERDVSGSTKIVKIQVATGLVLEAAGKKTSLKLEPPHRDAIVPGAEKNMVLTVRTLDLKGQTLTGTRREFCLVSFTSLVECPEDPANQVVRVEFR
jgi:hypothetical protein